MYGMTNDPLSNLDLSANRASESISLLKPGRHVCKSVKAEYENKDGRKSLRVKLVALDGGGEITWRGNLWSQNDKAREISGDQLKALCLFGGHSNPDKPLPAGLASLPLLEGMTVGVRVDNGKEYTDRDGNKRIPVEVKGFFRPDEVSVKPTAASEPVANGRAVADDEIPFAPEFR